jgi:hypothetical protein
MLSSMPACPADLAGNFVQADLDLPTFWRELTTSLRTTPLYPLPLLQFTIDNGGKDYGRQDHCRSRSIDIKRTPPS